MREKISTRVKNTVNGSAWVRKVSNTWVRDLARRSETQCSGQMHRFCQQLHRSQWCVMCRGLWRAVHFAMGCALLRCVLCRQLSGNIGTRAIAWSSLRDGEDSRCES